MSGTGFTLHHRCRNDGCPAPPVWNSRHIISKASAASAFCKHSGQYSWGIMTLWSWRRLKYQLWCIVKPYCVHRRVFKGGHYRGQRSAGCVGNCHKVEARGIGHQFHTLSRTEHGGMQNCLQLISESPNWSLPPTFYSVSPPKTWWSAQSLTGRYLIVMGYLNTDIGWTQNPWNQQVADFLDLVGLIDLLAHFRQRLQFRNRQMWCQVCQGKVMRLHCDYIIRSDRRLFETVVIRNIHNLPYDVIYLHVWLLSMLTSDMIGTYGDMNLPIVPHKNGISPKVDAKLEDLKDMEAPPPSMHSHTQALMDVCRSHPSDWRTIRPPPPTQP